MADRNMVKYVCKALLFLCCLQCALCAKILFLFPHQLPSHYRAFSPIIDKLASNGHQITAYVAPKFVKQKPIPNLKEIAVPPKGLQITQFDFLSWRNSSVLKYVHVLWTLIPTLTDGVLQSRELQDLMQSSEKFDLVIVESTFGQECLLAFGHKFKAPVVNLHPILVGPQMALLTGLPHPFSYVPDFRLPLTDQMSIWGRTTNTLIGLYELIGANFWYLPFVQEPMLRKYFKYPGSESIPSIKEMFSDVSLHLIDAHSMIGYIRPYSSNVINVAGAHIKPAGKLPQDLQKFMDEATEGVIYFSFGSFIDVKTFPDYYRNIFVETLKSLKQRVIWKWHEEIPDAPNVLTSTWLPQVEILTHPNCKLFITHGGFNSLVEAMSIGKPVLGIPFFGDQFYNVAFYEHRGVGLEADLNSLSAPYLKEKIERIIYTPSFAENAKLQAKIFKDEPQTSLERAVFWIEYVIRHKGAHHLKPASAKLPLYKYLLLDVIAFWSILFYLVVRVIRQLTQTIVGSFGGGKNQPTTAASKVPQKKYQ